MRIYKTSPILFNKKNRSEHEKAIFNRIQQIIHTTVWDDKLEKAISAKDQELTDTTESYKEMAWMEFDESAEFGKNGLNNINMTSSKSDSDDSQEEKEHGMADNMADEVSTFQTKVVKKKMI